MGSEGRKTYFPHNKVQKREGKAPAYPSLSKETTGSARVSTHRGTHKRLIFYFTGTEQKRRRKYTKKIREREKGKEGW